MKKVFIRLILSGLIAVGIGYYAYNNMPITAEEIEYLTVMVAKENIGVNETLTMDRVASMNIRKDSVIVNDYIEELNEQKIARVPILEGYIISERMLTDIQIQETMPEHRLFPVPVSAEFLGSAGVGDRVDVLFYSGDRVGGISKTILSDIIVKSLISKEGFILEDLHDIASAQRKIEAAGVAELLVTISEANILFQALQEGTIKIVKYLPESKPVNVDVIEPLETTQPAEFQPADFDD